MKTKGSPVLTALSILSAI